MNRRLQQFLILSIALAAGLAGYWFATQQQRSESDLSVVRAAILKPPKPLADFSLADHQGRPFSLDNLRDRWSLLFFGYTYCPDVCPTTLTNLKNVTSMLADHERVEHPLQVVFVSVDPERDTTEKLSSYVSYFDPGFIGITGTHEEIRKLTRHLGVLYVKHAAKPGDAYLVDHTAAILLINPRGELRALFSPPHDTQLIADGVKRIRNHDE